MTKLIHDRPTVVPRDKRLDDSGDPLPVHIEASRARKKALAERLKPQVATNATPRRYATEAPDKLVKCEKCLTEVKLCNLIRHKRRSCKPKKALPSSNGKAVIERVQCMHCNKKVANMKSHIKDKHGFLLLPDGTVTIVSSPSHDTSGL
jgi:hypothetical protein